ncbi:MAG: hypothetical protein N3F03_06625 [Ignavibacteria bacterium]|nr:hypothetical protein [Ignavibacteria bacterium]
MRLLVSYFVIILLIFISSLYPQKFDKILAEIGNQKLTANEFKLRYELSPFVSNRAKWNKDTLKLEFLFSMIAERLWYLDAIEKGLNNSEDFRFYFKPLEDIFLRDYLFKMEIEDKIKLSAQDVSNGINKAQFKLKARIINSEDSIKIFKVFDYLNKKISIDSILKIPEFMFLSSGEFEISLGSLKDEEVEDYLFALNPTDFSKPIRSEIGWVIFYITEKVLTPIDISNQKTIDEIKRTIKSRRVMLKSQDYLKNLLSNQTYDINDSIFNEVFNAIYDLILTKTKDNPDSIRASYVLNDYDFREIKKKLGTDLLQQELFKVENQSITVWDFLANLAFEEHRFHSKDRRQIYSQLSKIIKNFVVQQRLVIEAKRKNLDKNKNLIEELENWKVNYLATQLRLTYLDSARVTEDEVFNYFRTEFRKDKSSLLLKLRILNLDNLEEVEKVLNQISTNKSFEEIVKQFGRTDSLVNDSGESQLLPHFYFGDIGTMALKLNPKEVYGPINRNGKYTLIEVIEKREIPDTVEINFESSKNYISNYLFMKKFNEVTSRRTLELAQKYGVKIYEDVLSEIKTTSIPMFVHRLMGFGGRIAGVPLLDNWFQFIDLKEFKSKLLP